MARVAKAVPLSLVHLFEPPDGFAGRFGWVCGYSADAAFVDRAAERFTHLTAARRAFAGEIVLAAMLDPGNPQISPIDVPGMLHLPLRSDAKTEFKLLHAKVALLGFAHERDAEHWYLRLIVSTGNWTRQTLEESLDLAWQVDLDRDALKHVTDDVRQARVDIGAAAAFLKDLRELFDTRAIPTSDHGQTAMEKLDLWVTDASDHRTRSRPRFFDNRKRSLLEQLPECVARASGETARNRLIMGSGFYEAPSPGKKIPSVLEDVARRLQGDRLLTNNAKVDVFVNPLACQGVAHLEAPRWTVRRPPDAPDWQRNRTLHAKFIFSANWREDSDRCSSAWLYLGSGNLTKPGFANRAHRQGGNLEAGIVISADGLNWSELSERLPVDGLEDALSLKLGDVQAGAEMEERPIGFFAPPVAFLRYLDDAGTRWLRCLDDQTVAFQVLTPDAMVCPHNPGQGFEWRGAAPRQVRVRWTDDSGAVREADVPVVDSFGRVAGSVLQALDLDSVWAQLSDFPLPPPEDELEDSEPVDGTMPGSPGRAPVPGSYAIRALMTFVENIAAKQALLRSSDWRTWCARLEQTLTLARECEDAKACRALGVNVLSPLRHPEFRPNFAENSSTVDGQFYEGVLTRIEQAWQIDTLPKLEERL